MNKLLADGKVYRIKLDDCDSLYDMASVSGYTIEKLKRMIEQIINKSIEEEVTRDDQLNS